MFPSFALTLLIRGDSYLGTDWGGLSLLTIILMEIVVRWLVSLEAPRPIQTDRDAGMLELVLVTPLTSEQVGSWFALEEIDGGFCLAILRFLLSAGCVAAISFCWRLVFIRRGLGVYFWHGGRLWARAFAWQAQRKLHSLRQLAGG